jgi:7-carboxy-7-deazaguanine synthase
MNEQMAVPVEKHPADGKLAVEETFYTLQGEGIFSGQPAVFVRLSGCTLKCTKCDTFYSTFNKMLPLDAYLDAERLAPIGCELCVVTGGEPFRQLLFPELVRLLLLRFTYVQIETSGSCWQPAFAVLKLEFKERLVVVCSPKTTKLHKELIPWIDHYKYVVADGESDERGLPNIDPQSGKEFSIARPVANRTGIVPPIWLSPWDEQDAERNQRNMDHAAELCLKHGYRLSLQVHKLLGLR